ncbi:MAG TPA: type II toxin-antitoxin system RelE/ParE family toxin [Elusimicrobiota bacterium]|nr:type II toxin-antitoxin system RelE/ParE family toxin [Elusimicrobiota bacterium]
MYRIAFYRTPRDECPFQIFLEGHNEKVRTKFGKLVTALEEYGPNLKRPYADILRDDIRELRVGFGGNSYRALYFFFIRDLIVITHAFTKKTDSVPPAEIERALRYKKDFETRLALGEYEL